MNRFSARERRLIVVLGGVLLIFAVVFLLGLKGDDVVGVPDLGLPTPVESAAPSPGAASPTFIVPAGARDPFKP